MQYLCYQTYNPKKLSLNTGDFFLLNYINVFFSLYKFRSEPLDVRSEPLNVRSEPLNVRSKPLNVRSEPLNVRSKPLNVRSELLNGDFNVV